MPRLIQKAAINAASFEVNSHYVRIICSYKHYYSIVSQKAIIIIIKICIKYIFQNNRDKVINRML